MAYDVNKLTKLSQLKALAEKIESDYATQASLNALSGRVDDLVTAGGEPNKLEGVKVNGTALAIANKMVDLLIASGTANGNIKVNNVDIAVKGLAALAYKAKISQSDFDTALATAFAAKAEQSALNAVKGDVDTLKGTGAGSVKKTVDDAINKFATDLTDDGVVNSFKELVDWVATHGSDAADMAGDIADNATAIADINKLIGTLPEGATSTTVVAYIAEAIAAIGIGDYAKTEDMNLALGNKVDKNGTDRLMTVEEGEKLAGIATGATKVEKSSTNGNVKINGTETAVYKEPSDVVHGAIATDAEVTEMLNEVFTA